MIVCALRLYPANPGWGLWCVPLGTGLSFTPLILAGVTVKALRDLTTPGNGLHEAIVDLVLWPARKHTQGQHLWIPPSSGARP